MGWHKTARDGTTFLNSTIIPVSGTSARTVVMKFKTSDTYAAVTRMGGWGTNTSGARWGWWLDHSASYAIRVEVSSGFATGTKPLNDGLWHTVAFGVGASANITSLSLYIDGLADPISDSLSRSVNTGTGTNFYLGIDGAIPGDGLICSYADFAIYNRLLSEQEMAEITSGRKSLDDFIRGRLLYWKLDKNAKDYGLRNRRGVINGTNYKWGGGPIDRRLTDDLLIGSTYPVVGSEEETPFGYSNWWFANQRQISMLKDRRNANLKR